MRSRGFGGAAIVALLLVGCGGRPPVKEKEAAAPPTPTEVKVTPLTNAKVTAGRAAGYLPSLTVPYAPVEILGPPAGLATPTEACVAAGKGTAIINNSGVVVGYDCRNNPGAWMPSGGLAYYPLYSAARTVGPLSTATANVLPTFALPVPTNNRGAMPFAINDSGTIAGYAYPTDQNLVNQGRWPGVIWESGSYPSPYTLTNLDSLWTVGGITNGVKPKLVGGDWNADWITYDTASATAPTVLADPASGLGLGNLYGTNSWGDLVGNYQKSDGTWWAWARKDGAWVDINAVAQTPHPFARIEGLRAVNDSRRAVGWGIFPGGTASSWTRRALQYDLVTNTVTLIPISPNRTYQGQEFIAKGINAKGHVVGAFMGGGALGTIGVYPQGKGWVWTPEYGIRELDTFINPALGLSIGDGHAINDYDEVAALDARVISGAWKVQLLRTKVDFGGPEFIEPSAGLNCSMASAINNASAVTGWSDACANNPWPSAGQAIPFATTASGAPVRLGAPTDPGGIHATAINEAGNVVATRFVSATSTFAPVVYRAGHWDVAAEQPSGITGAASLAALDEDTASGGPRLFGSEYVTGVGQTWFSYFDGTKTALPRLASANTDGALLGANDAGEAVGFFGTSSGLAAAAYTGGATTALSASGWTSLNAAYAINAAHQVVGYGVKGGATRAFKMTLGGNTVEIPALESPYANLAHVARAINAAGQVVGTAGTVDLLGHVTGQRAFIFSEDTGITDLNALTAMPAGWVLADASGINDSGEVVGYAVDAAGVRRAYKMKVPAMPVTECAGKADGASCNDLNRCTQNDTCQAGVCVGSNPVVCNGTPNQCQLAQTCDVNTGLCVFPNKAAYTACNDNNPCSLTDACFNGVCTGTTFKQCVAKDQCHVAGVCDTGTGQCPDPVGNEGAACNDGNACTTASVCTAGTCTGTTQAPPCASGTTCDPATTANYLPEGVPQSALAALWHMDDHRDSSENAAHWAVASSALPSKVVPGKVGGALEFEGTHWLGVSSPYYYDVTDAPGFTFAAWVKPNVTCPGTYGFLRRDWQFGLKLTCTAGGTPGLQVGMNTGAGPFSSLSYSAAMGAVPVGQWSHIAMTWDKQTIRIYVNGAEAGTVSKSGNLPAPVGYFQLGWNENYYRGTIDEAVLYRQALTPAQLATITTVAPTACKVPTCPVPANTCQVATYDAATSACVTTNKANGASCSDGNACTVGDTCLTGTCVAGAGAPTCSTAVTCQESTCDPQWKETPAADVVSLWHLDGNLTEPAGHNLTGTASVAAVAGKFGQAMHFDGVATSCATRPSTSGESFTNPAGVTIAAWVKPDSNACPSGVQHMIVNRAAEVGLNLVCSGNYLLIRPQLNTVEYNSLGAIPTGVWSHVAITYDPPTGKLDAYHNGARIGTWSVPPGTQVGTSQYGRGLTLQVGCAAAAAVDEAIVIRRSSTAAEIANMAGSPSLCNEHPKTCLATDTCHTNGTCDPQTGQCPSPPAKQAGAACSDDNACTTGDTCNAAGQCVPGTPVSVSCAAPATCKEAGVCKTDEVPVPPALGRVGWWRFEGDTRDSGGQGLDLVRNGGTVGEGRIGKAFEFDGNTCMHMTNALPPLAMNGATAISMMAWVKTGAGWTCPASGYRAIMGKGYDYSLNASCTGVNTPGLTHIFRNQAGTIDNGPTPVVGTQPQNAWTHVAVVWDGSTIRRYVNGAYVSQRAFAGTPGNVDPSFSIGCQTATQFATFQNLYKGSIDEAVLYNRALEDADVLNYYNAASSHSCAYANKENGTTCIGDSDACTKEACQAGACANDGVVTCTAQGPCGLVGTCNPGTGTCSNPSPTGSSCQAGGANGPTFFEPTDGFGCSQATGINRVGNIVGYSDACSAPAWPDTQTARPFMTYNGATQSLSLPVGQPSLFGTAISAAGHVIANGVESGTSYIYDAANPTTPPDLLPFGGGRALATRTDGYGNWPTVLGSMAFVDDHVWASYDVTLPIPSYPPIDLYPHPGLTEGAALAANEGRTLVGYYRGPGGPPFAMRVLPGSNLPEELGPSISAVSGDWFLSVATGINDAGTIVGFGTQNWTTRRPFRMDSYGNVTNLGTFLDGTFADPAYYDLAFTPSAINSGGRIVGTAGIPLDEIGQRLIPQRAWVYTDLSKIQDLNDLVQMPPGWVLVSAVGINDLDEVAGIAENQTTHQRRAYKVKLPGLPDVAQVACAGKVEGDPCSPGRTCEANNVCHAGVCGGGAPADALCLSVDAVVDMQDGTFRAVFGYDSFNADTTVPSPNEVTLGATVVSAPQPSPPAWLPPGDHPETFQQSFPSGGVLAWRVNGQKASTSATTPIPKQTDAAGDYVIIKGKRVALKPNLVAFAAIPDDPFPTITAGEPSPGPHFNGALTGSLGVSPTGAATYAVPIAIPPGIAGMAPNLSLAYNSQGGNGIAGRGWELTGLSAIHRCPKERLHDGYSRPIHNNTLDPSAFPEEQRDGLCLDGMHMFERSPGVYEVESNDFSSITKVIASVNQGTVDPPFSFKVVTKSGETRHYGSGPASTVMFAVEPDGVVQETRAPAIWALDRVMDTWGNYFDVEYNDGQKDFFERGLIATKISYTGHAPSGSLQCDDIADGCTDTRVGAVPPFLSVRFTYESREDVRNVRFGSSSLPKPSRLTKIATTEGQYALEYQPLPTPRGDSLMLPSMLTSITYCANPNGDCSVAHCQTASDCLRPLEFDWDGGGYFWDHVSTAATAGQENSYDLPPPARLDTFLDEHSIRRSYGTKFMDINGDGRPDLVHATNVFHNQLWENNGHGWTERPDWDFPASFALTPTGRVGQEIQVVDMDADGILDVVLTPEFGGSAGPGPVVYLNRTRQSGGWERKDSYLAGLPAAWGDANVRLNHDFYIAEMNGDSRADLVWFDNTLVRVAINNGDGWSLPTLDYNWNYPGAVILTTGYHLEDVNRDGLTDISSNSGNDFVTFNCGANVGDYGAVWHAATYPGLVNLPTTQPGRVVSGDVDGDGYLDKVSSYRDAGPNFPLRQVVSFGTGIGYTGTGTTGYYGSLVNSETPPYPNPTARVEDEHFGLADLNADGLVDYILNYRDGGQLMVNNGRFWWTLEGGQSRTSGWNASAGPNRVPVVPSAAEPGYGAMFIDLDGDGVLDLVRAAPPAEGLPVDRTSWLNRFRPPVIARFPNGLAKKTEVTYVGTNTEAGASVYTNSTTLAPNTKFSTTPIRVVASVSTEDGSGTGAMAETTYRYYDLRESSTGHGPQGFRTVSVAEPDGSVTVTQYAQVHPFTGTPLSVTRMKNGVLVTTTANVYCAKSTAEATPTCGSEAAVPAIEFPPKSTVFVYPKKVVDKAFLRKASGASEILKTTTSFEYDDRGSATLTTVETENEATGERYQKKTESEYGSSGSLTQRMGKATKTTVTSQRLQPAGTPTVHTTEFQYGLVHEYADELTNDPNLHTLAMTKKLVEPGRAATDHPYSPYVENAFELHTAYGYDRYGNVTATTSCANDFDDCVAGASGPSGTDPNHLPFRTTLVSYEPTDFVAPSPTLPVQLLSYLAKGRFPVKATNPEGHVEYSAYDWVTGHLVQKTAPDGVSSCFTFDKFGRPVTEVTHCGSGSPVTSETHQYVATEDSPGGAKVVTVTRVATGQATWVYSNSVGRTIETRSRSFEGGWVQAQTAYDSLGRVATSSKPRKMGGDPVFATTPHYDALGRVDQVTQDLGVVDPTRGPTTSTTKTIFDGSTITTEDTIGGVEHQHRRVETKNAMGKVASVEDANGKAMTYSYDGDGNLTETEDSDHVQVQLQYDRVGRRRVSQDPDLGTWHYFYNAFGDLVAQVDANEQPVVMAYDRLGRIRTKLDGTGTATWLYDVASGAGIGKLAAQVSAPDARLNGACAGPYGVEVDGKRTARWFTYTPGGQIQQTYECADGETFATTYGYDHVGRTASVTYPQIGGDQLVVGYKYTNLGFLQAVTDSPTSALWVAKEIDAAGNVTTEYTRNGVETVTNRNLSTGWAMSSTSVAHGDGERQIQGFSYRYDEAGNLLERDREDAVTPRRSEETFQYDALDRLLSSSVSLPASGELPAYTAAQSATYYDNGNIQTKNGVSYGYSGCGGRPHAVCSVGSESTYSYDLNGNVRAGGGRIIGYNVANKPVNIARGAEAVQFIYGADGHRVVQDVSHDLSSVARTVYVGLGDTGKSIYERTIRRAAPGSAEVVEHSQFIYAGTSHGGNALALRTTNQRGASFSSPADRYYHVDRLGSVTTVSDAQGHVVTEAFGGPNADVIGYDAWGAQRHADGRSADPASFNLQAGHRGFTGHETIPDVGLINMNGRVYDPQLGRFLSPDPHVQFVGNLQSYNRYSYVLNNPLRYTDPTGYFNSDDFTQVMLKAIPVAIVVVGVIACPATAGGGCLLAFGAVAAMEAAFIAKAQGASNGEAFMVGWVVMMSSALGVAGASVGATTPMQQILVGAGSGAMQGLFATIAGGGNLGENMLNGAARGGVFAIYGIAIKSALSQATAAEAQGGGGSGEARLQKAVSHGPNPGAPKPGEPGWFDYELDEALGRHDAQRVAEARAAAAQAGLVIPREWKLEYDSALRIEAETDGDRMTITLGRSAFKNRGWLVSTIGHELVHVDQFMLGNVSRAGLHLNDINEMEAYDWELRNATRNGLTQADIKNLQTRRLLYDIGADPTYVLNASRGNYLVLPAQR